MLQLEFNSGTTLNVANVLANLGVLDAVTQELPQEEIRVLVDTSIARTVILPVSTSFPIGNVKITIVDKTGSASINPITILPTSPDTIGGLGSVLVNGAYQATQLQVLKSGSYDVMSTGTGGAVVPVTVTSAEILALASEGLLVPTQIYEISDVEAGLLIMAVNNSSLAITGQVQFFTPNYLPSGLYMGQYNSSSGAVLANQIYIWGGFYWQNTSGSTQTPNLHNAIIFDDTGNFTQIPKSLANNYILNILTASFASYVPLSINELVGLADNLGNSFISSIGFANQLPFLNMEWYYLVPTTNATVKGNTGLLILNNLVINAKIVQNQGSNLSGMIANNLVSGNPDGDCGIQLNIMIGGGAKIMNNIIINDTSIVNNILVNNGTISGNTMTALEFSGHKPFIAFCELSDGCHIDDNTLSGAFATIEAVNSITFGQVNSNIMSGQQTHITAIVQADGSLNNNILSGDGTAISNMNQAASQFDSFVLSSPSKSISNVTQVNSNLQNGNDIQIQNCFFDGINIDFTGFTADVVNETIQTGKGWFTVDYSFFGNHLAAGDSVFLNIIPQKAVITNCTFIPTEVTGDAGATLSMGMSVDDPTYALNAQVITGLAITAVTTLSAQASGNRSLQLTAGTGNITGGDITVKVEFIIQSNVG